VKSDKKSPNAKKIYEAFSLHYLVDMFASGHMRTPRAAIQDYLEDGRHLSYNPHTRTKNAVKDLSVAVVLPELGLVKELDEGIKSREAPGRYDKRNAEIVGALLSCAQHDHDNYSGLTCFWTGPTHVPGHPPAADRTLNGVDPRPASRAEMKLEWLGDPAGLSSGEMRYHGNFTGDANLHALQIVERAAERGGVDHIDDDARYPTDDLPDPGTPEDHLRERQMDDGRPHPRDLNAKKHLYGTVAAHVLHVFPELAAPVTPVPWPGADAKLQQEAFLARVAPQPVLRDGGWMRVMPGQDHVVVCWYGPKVVHLWKWVKLTVETDSDHRIKHVTLEIPYLEIATLLVAAGAAAVAGPSPVLFNKLVDYAMPMDGNDPQVRELFKDVQVVTWLAENAQETLDVDTELAKLGLKKTKEWAQKIGELEAKLAAKTVKAGKDLSEYVHEVGTELKDGAVDLSKKVGQGAAQLSKEGAHGLKEILHTIDRMIESEAY
jgi:hypothetical protein